jgi:hypothetical protein
MSNKSLTHSVLEFDTILGLNDVELTIQIFANILYQAKGITPPDTKPIPSVQSKAKTPKLTKAEKQSIKQTVLNEKISNQIKILDRIQSLEIQQKRLLNQLPPNYTQC